MESLNLISSFIYKKNRDFISLIFLLFTVSILAQSKIDTPKTYIANYTEETITVDGLGNEKSWQKAPYSDLFIDIEGVKKPTYNTRFKMLWDNSNVYFFAEMEEPHVWGNLKQRDTIVYYNNDFEIFIDPDGDAHNYYEVEINALNTIWDLFLTKPYRDGAVVLNDWDVNGLQSAVQINGTLNNPNDTDKGWTLEIAIPLNVFKASYHENTNPKGRFWRVNFSRVNWDFQLENTTYQRKKNADGTFKREYNWVWSPQGVIAMHQPETWGYVYFSNKRAGEQDAFQIPKDEYIKWFLFKLHNDLKAKKITGEAVETATIILNHSLTPTYQNHETGYNIWIDSPFSTKRIILNQEGKILIKKIK
ncbi:carbohydrate-binding family 9-like protein [Flavivirga eckloniae]|uniref:Carbohydrate-binding family 9-like protein n=1 Tax=Flavivirga eckloniae TaxID=1803846 RepID=A0A2K9PSP1_9FLAO|nr:carbohydrate-binding family 9-like protein [Flavivirga eckloniae]AUP80076.1 carbohydrate-binding family 9-like protein [Flavivirga eckloniae]